MKIKYYGRSCFMLTDEKGVRILTDPCDPSTGYELNGIEADVVTISHGHHDHNYKTAVCGDPVFVETVGKHEVHGISIHGFRTFHDNCRGEKRGENIMFKYIIDGMSVVHAGDIGSIANIASEDIGDVDVLFVPVGGVYTIDSHDARLLANVLKPKVVIPMHYKTSALTFDLDSVDGFVNGAVDCKIHRLNQSEAVLTKESLGEDRILVLSHK